MRAWQTKEIKGETWIKLADYIADDRRASKQLRQAENDFWELLRLLDPENPDYSAYQADLSLVRGYGVQHPRTTPPERGVVLKNLRARLEREKFDKMTRAEKDAYLLEKVLDR